MVEEPQQITTRELQQVTTKNLKKVEAGKRLAAHNHKKRKEKKREEQVQVEKGGVNQYYGIGAVLAVRVIGGLVYYIYQTKKGGLPGPENREVKDVSVPHNPTPRPQTNKFEMD